MWEEELCIYDTPRVSNNYPSFRALAGWVHFITKQERNSLSLFTYQFFFFFFFFVWGEGGGVVSQKKKLCSSNAFFILISQVGNETLQKGKFTFGGKFSQPITWDINTQIMDGFIKSTSGKKKKKSYER